MTEEPRYAGMTVNERLTLAGLLPEFDEAARHRDRERMMAILQKVELTSEQSASTVDAILANPAFYGY